MRHGALFRIQGGHHAAVAQPAGRAPAGRLQADRGRHVNAGVFSVPAHTRHRFGVGLDLGFQSVLEKYGWGMVGVSVGVGLGLGWGYSRGRRAVCQLQGKVMI